MTYDELIEGLKRRHFVGIDEICNKGGCHSESKCHFILLTDGLVIWSNYWNWNDKYPTTKCESWPLEASDYDIENQIQTFEFWRLDQIMGKS